MIALKAESNFPILHAGFFHQYVRGFVCRYRSDRGCADVHRADPWRDRGIQKEDGGQGHGDRHRHFDPVRMGREQSAACARYQPGGLSDRRRRVAFLLAIDMLFARHSGLRSTTLRERQEAEHRNDISVFPLAIPLIAGPGALTTVLLMLANGREQPFITAIVLGVLVLVLLITLVTLLFAVHIMRFIGETGANVISRVLGIVLTALAVQFVLDGISTQFFAGRF